jgi:hypothetical protein
MPHVVPADRVPKDLFTGVGQGERALCRMDVLDTVDAESGRETLRITVRNNNRSKGRDQLAESRRARVRDRDHALGGVADGMCGLIGSGGAH